MPNRRRGARRYDRAVAVQVKKRRGELKLSQAALGKKLGITQFQICQYERGMSRIAAGTLYEIACVTNTPVEYFFASCK